MNLNTETFKPRARLMLLLGDQLIRDTGIAVFELVKNSYDADASRCEITLRNINTPKARIVIEDDGVGMKPEIVTGVWFEPGTDFRKRQREKGIRTAKGRLPLGEKGIGRFAVHKLGEKITVITRATGQFEVVVEIDWGNFGDDLYLSDVPIKISLRSPLHFKGKKTGTRIEVSNLREKWTRGKVRDLYRSITSICSPFKTKQLRDTGAFDVDLVLSPEPDSRKSWLKGLLEVNDVIENALFRGSGLIEGDNVTYDYEFRPLPAMKARIKGRELRNIRERIFGILDEEGSGVSSRSKPKPIPIDLSKWKIGPIHFDFHIFDREPIVMDLATSDRTGLKKFLDINGGIRVFRDGIRIYDFGAPGNDWLGLGDRRVNIPVKRIGNNQIIAAVTLDSVKSTDLVEKTNREGFIENDAYSAFRIAVLFTLRQIEVERNLDKERLRKEFSRKKIKEPVVEEIALLRDKLKKRNMLKEFELIVDRIENQFIVAKERLLSPAAAGLNLMVVIHEVEKIVDNIVKAVEQNAAKNKIAKLLKNLSNTIEGISFLMKSSGLKEEKAGILIRQALFNFDYRFRAHGIRVINGLAGKSISFLLKCYRRLIVSTLMNLMDNSIYWLENKGSKDKKIFIDILEDLHGGPAFVVADNGPGFQEYDPPEFLVQPFISRKDDGMGLGLHIANEVAKLHKGHLLFPEADEIDIPIEFTGAVVALKIPMKKE